MKNNRQRATATHGKEGFALVVAISLMGFILLLSISLATLTRVETVANSANSHLAQARQNAQLGMMAALSELQAAAGPDQRALMTADALDNTRNGAAQWLGSWDTTDTNADPVWLVSGTNPSPDSAIGESVTIVGAATLGDDNSAGHVMVPKVAIEGTNGAFAWWVADQSLKASITDFWIPQESLQAYNTAYMGNSYKPEAVKKGIARRVPMRRAVEEAIPGLSEADIKKLGNVLSLPQIDLIVNNGVSAGELFHDINSLSLGLLTNPVEGGLKYNLTDASADPYGFLNESLVAYLAATRISETGYPNNPYTGRSPFTSREYLRSNNRPIDTSPTLVLTPPLGRNDARSPLYPDFSKSGEGYAFFAPILTDAMLRLSFVMDSPGGPGTPTNTYVRTDFVIETWNPYPFALEMARRAATPTSDATLPSHRMYFTDFSNNMVTVTNRRGIGGAVVESFTIDLNDLGNTATQQLDSNLAIPPYIEYFYDSLARGSGSSGPALLYPGESYAGRHPHDHWQTTWDGNKSGILNRPANGASKWAYTSDAAELASAPPAGTTAWLHSDDIVTIDVKGSFNLTISYNVNAGGKRNTAGMYNQNHIDNAQIRITGIPVDTSIDVPVTTSDNEDARFYYDNDRRDHHRNQFQLAVRIKLKDGLSDLDRMAAEFDPRTQVVTWDQIKDYYDVEYLRNGELDGISFNENDLFVHKSDHAQGPESYRYSTDAKFFENGRFVKLFDVPTYPAVSLDVFRSAYFVDMPPFSFGEPQSGLDNGTGGRLNAAFDRYFMTGIHYTWTPAIQANKPTSALPNPNQIFPNWENALITTPTQLQTKLSGQNAAENLMVAGSFNINSTSVVAWAAALASPQFVGDDMLSSQRGVIMHLPHEPLTDEAIETALSDSELAALPNAGDAFRNAVFAQTIRVFDDPSQANTSSALYLLAEHVVEEIKDWQEQKGRPFFSMEEFANSAVLKTAIEKSDINTLGSKKIPALSPLYISQSKLLGILSNFSTVRGDTFLIRSYGEAQDPITGNPLGHALCEAVVQRRPEFIAPEQNSPDASLASLSETNRNFGRRFHIVAFTWLEGEGG